MNVKNVHGTGGFNRKENILATWNFAQKLNEKELLKNMIFSFLTEFSVIKKHLFITLEFLTNLFVSLI